MCWPPCNAESARRAGLTLIEVLAGLALMGTILVALVRAKSDSALQWHEANRRLEGIEAAEHLLRRWTTPAPGMTPGIPATSMAGGERSVPLEASGSIEDYPHLRWQTRIVTNPQAEFLGAQVVRLEILRAETLQPAKQDAPLAYVELLVPSEEPSDSAQAPSIIP